MFIKIFNVFEQQERQRRVNRRERGGGEGELSPYLSTGCLSNHLISIKNQKKEKNYNYINDSFFSFFHIIISYLFLLLTTQFEVLASLKNNLVRKRALTTLELEDNLLSSLSLLVENGLGLTTITGLLTVVTALTYRKSRYYKKREKI
jgi:hypothetical protein